MAGKNNTTRIEDLEGRVASIQSWLNAYVVRLQAISEDLTKCVDASEGHTLRITIIEQQILLVDLKGCAAAIARIEKDMVGLKKDLDGFGKWKEELKKERDEVARRLWAFGPNVLAAIISGIISLAVALLVVWLNKPR